MPARRMTAVPGMRAALQVLCASAQRDMGTTDVIITRWVFCFTAVSETHTCVYGCQSVSACVSACCVFTVVSLCLHVCLHVVCLRLSACVCMCVCMLCV